METMSDEEKKVEENAQSVEEAVTVEANETNLREKFAEAGGFDIDDPDDHRQGFAIPSTADEIADAGKRWGEGTWQLKLLKIINSDFVQRFLVALLLMDVLVLFVELALDAFFPMSQLVVRDAISCCPKGSDYEGNEDHRFLGGGGSREICAYPLQETEYKAGYDNDKYHGIHVAHTALYSLTITILASFLVELLMLVYLLGPKHFFKQITYALDFVVVVLSLSLEILLKHASQDVLSVLPGLLIVFRLWRFVRIGHGLVASTFEMQQHKLHIAASYIEELEEKMKKHNEDVQRSQKMDKIMQRLSSSHNVHAHDH